MSESKELFEKIFAAIKIVENRMDGFEKEVRKLETQFTGLRESIFFSGYRGEDAKAELRKIAEIENKMLKSLTPQERKIYGYFRSDSGKGVTLAKVQEKAKLNYKTVAGYANRFVRYGLIEREWDSSRRINTYTVRES